MARMRPLAALLAAALLCLALAACGGDGEPASPTATATATPSATEAVAEPEPTATPTAAVTAAVTVTATVTATPTEPADEDDDKDEWDDKDEDGGDDEKEWEDGERVWEASDGPVPITVGGERPALLLVPREADRSEPRPLVLLLHGYGGDGELTDAYFQFSPLVNELGFGLLLPTGTRDEQGDPFWNGAECCDMYDTGVDDAGYLKGLIGEARGHAAFDKVAAVGHSNGGFMAYRLACEAVPDLIAIVSLAGGAYASADSCRAPSMLSVLQIHGDRDFVIRYEGGRLKGPLGWTERIPGAEESVLRWAERAGCDLNAAEELTPIDTDTLVEGAETAIRRWREGCAGSTVHELWTIEGGGHVPFVWGTDFTWRILLWLNDAYTGEVTIEAGGAAE